MSATKINGKRPPTHLPASPSRASGVVTKQAALSCVCAAGATCGAGHIGSFITLPDDKDLAGRFLRILLPDEDSRVVKMLLSASYAHYRIRAEHFSPHDLQITAQGRIMRRKAPGLEILPHQHATREPYTPARLLSIAAEFRALLVTCFCRHKDCPNHLDADDSNSVPLPTDRAVRLSWLRTLMEGAKAADVMLQIDRYVRPTDRQPRVFVSHFKHADIIVRGTKYHTIAGAIPDAAPVHYHTSLTRNDSTPPRKVAAVSVQHRESPQTFEMRRKIRATIPPPIPPLRLTNTPGSPLRQGTAAAPTTGSSSAFARSIRPKTHFQQSAVQEAVLMDLVKGERDPLRVRVSLLESNVKKLNAIVERQEQQIADLKAEVGSASEKQQKPPPTALPSNPLEQLMGRLHVDANFCHYSTGLLSFEIVKLLYAPVSQLLPPRDPRGRKAQLSSLEEFSIFLILFHRMKSVAGMFAIQCGIHRATLWRIYRKWLLPTATLCRETTGWPSYQEALGVTTSRTQSLLRLKSKTAVFYGDCVEIETLKTHNTVYDAATFSNYKQMHSLKYLVVIAANGTIVHISEAYPGATTDARIHEGEGIARRIAAIAAPEKFCFAYVYDKGLTDNSVFEALGVHLVTPMRKLPNQVSVPVRIVMDNASIAQARILVERVIGRLKTQAAFAATRRPRQAEWDRHEILVAQLLTNFSLNYSKEPPAQKPTDVRIDPVTEPSFGKPLYLEDEPYLNSEDEEGIQEEVIKCGLYFDEETGEERLYLPQDIYRYDDEE